MSSANDLERWQWRQEGWDTARPDIEHVRDVGGWLTLHAEAQCREGTRQIHAVMRDGGLYVGEVFAGPHPTREGFLEGAPEVHPRFRRRGVCRALYDLAAELGGAPMAPAERHSADAAAFWARYGTA